MSLPGLKTSFLDGLDRAKCHVIVVCEQGGDALGVRRAQERFHDFLAFGAGEITALALDDVHARVGADGVHEALGAVQRGGRHRGVPESSTMVALPPVLSASQLPAFLPSSTKSEPMKVAYSEGSLTSTARSLRTHGNIGLLDLLHDRLPAGFYHGRKGDHVHALGPRTSVAP